ncbi:MAG TPA: arsenate reductase ArsC [Spirochaetota bacterium]|nr:arsenate reductase ArsC [Spirochaetota bacterium]
MGQKIKILFLCTGNSCRSQMAEGFANALRGDIIEAYSAGIEPKSLDQNAVIVMREGGVDISHHTSKHVNDLKDKQFDYVITVCGHANENCPVFPGKTKILHRGFEDPPQLAKEAKAPEEALQHYRRVRNQIKEFILELPGWLEKEQTEFFIH